MGRRPIGDKPMTNAEKQQRYRINKLGEVAGHLDILATLIRIRGDELADSGLDMAQDTALEFLRELLLHVELARIAVPRS